MAFLQKQKDNLFLDDGNLVRRSQRGDPEAMSCLIVKYQDRIYNSILKICANQDDAAELTQDTFVKVLESINTFRGQSGFYTWLFRVAVNLTLNHCRKRFKLSPVSLDGSNESSGKEREHLAALLADPSQTDPARIVQQKELVQVLLDLIARMNEEHRVVLVLRDIEQMSYSQIAEVLQVETGTVKSRLCRARAALRELMETVLT